MRSLHGVGFTRTSLAIGDDRAVETSEINSRPTIKKRLDDRRCDLLEDLLLGTVTAIYAIITEFHIGVDGATILGSIGLKYLLEHNFLVFFDLEIDFAHTTLDFFGIHRPEAAEDTDFAFVFMVTILGVKCLSSTRFSIPLLFSDTGSM